VPNIPMGETGAPASYAVNSGSGSGWDPTHDGPFVFDAEEPTKFASITDGLSNTIFVGEMDYGLRNYYWSGTSDVRGGVVQWGIGYPGYSIGTTVGVLNSDFLITGFDEFQTFRSDHHGGVFFLYGDGSVHFLADTIDATLLDALATRDGQEIIEYEN